MLRAPPASSRPRSAPFALTPASTPIPSADQCERKVARLRPVRGEIDGLEIWSAAKYDGVAREIVTKMKFAQRLTLAEVAAERMLRTVGAGRDVYCVPVPPSPARERARGFDLAYALSPAHHATNAGGQTILCLERDDGPRQVGRSRKERKSDPPTSGRSTRACRSSATTYGSLTTSRPPARPSTPAPSTLRQHGAKRVRALTFARADK